VTRALAALFTPLAVLASAHELFLRNQGDLGGSVSVLHPFWAVAAAAAALTLLLQRLDSSAPARAALVAVYTAGFAFVAWGFLRSLPAGAHLPRWVLDQAPGALAFVLAWAAAAVALGRRGGPHPLEPVVAVLAVVLAVHDSVAFAARLERAAPPPPRELAETLAGGDPSLPNVYHVVFDALQDDLVPRALPAVDEEASGFVRFSLLAPTDSTMEVMPAIFAGRVAPGAAAARVEEALRGEAGLPAALRRAGYRTAAFVPRFLYGPHREAFDLAVLHDEAAAEPDLPALHAAVFLRLWVFATLPRAAGESLAAGGVLGLGTAFFRMDGVERVSAFAQPLVSRLGLEALVGLEPRLPARGRYTLVHLLIPHNPYVLRRDCSSAPVGESTDVLEQHGCALRLLEALLGTLRSQSRLEGSIVVVHGDHGSGASVRAGRIEPDEAARRRTVLLVKPAGGRGPLRLAEATARLVDVAPTVLALAGVAPPPGLEGRPLAEALAQASERTGRAGTPATSVRGATSAVTTLPAATKD
jgi:hypothetical protein